MRYIMILVQILILICTPQWEVQYADHDFDRQTTILECRKMISSSSRQPLVLVYKRWRDDLVCRHHDELLFWGNMFFSLVGRGVSPAPNQQSTPIFSSVPSNLQCYQANILYKESYSKWWFEGGGGGPLVAQEAFFASFLGKFIFSKLPQFFSQRS